MFRIHVVPANSRDRDEPMGTKFKFWYEDPELGRCLFKAARPGHGEDWAEKAAQELAALIRVPAALYELAVWGHDPGVICPTFVVEGATLVHGNELLAGADALYALPSDAGRRSPSLYTVDRVLATLEQSGARPHPQWELPNGVSTAADVLTGYLLVDAWIGNTDRHHENWAVVDAPPAAGGTTRDRFVAPLYDSASCLGRNEPDEKRVRRLTTRDRNDTVAAYASRAVSAFYGAPGDARPLSPLDAFRRAAAIRPEAARAWLSELASIPPGAVQALFGQFPPVRVSGAARDFAVRMLEFNSRRLLDLAAELEPPSPRTTEHA
jgi:hypothetical protein